MIDTFVRALPNGISLSCRAAGTPGRPLMLFLHGFPEGAFVWDELMEHFAQPDNGGFRCIAPNLRGFERSSAPAELADYRAHLLVQDIALLAASESDGGRIDTLVAHDWGGAFGWGFANQHPERVGRLVIINSPHPGTFARELSNNPEQQAASAYMHWLAKPGSESILEADDFARLWPFLERTFAGSGGAAWLTDAVKDQYRSVWQHGLRGGCNLYRITPLKPPDAGEVLPELPRERLTVEVPTLVIWAMDDVALLPGLLDGLDEYVSDLQVHRVPGATHWIVHERPAEVAGLIQRFIASRSR